MQQALTMLQILVAVGLVGLVLLQQGRGADAGAAFGSGGSSTIFGARGSSSFLSRMTAVLAAVFFANSIALGYLSGRSVDRGSVTERFEVPTESVPREEVPKPGTFVSDVPDLPEGTQESDVPAPPEDSGEQTKQ